jgi:hypothetical protein
MFPCSMSFVWADNKRYYIFPGANLLSTKCALNRYILVCGKDLKLQYSLLLSFLSLCNRHPNNAKAEINFIIWALPGLNEFQPSLFCDPIISI